MSPARVLVAESSATVRSLLRRFLGGHPGIEIVAEVTQADQTVAEAFRLRPDAVVVDLDMPGMATLEVLDRIAERRPTPVLVITARTRREEVAAAFAAVDRGAVAVFSKPQLPEEWQDLAGALTQTILEIKPTSGAYPSTACEVGIERKAPGALRFLAVGASTGGPAALRELLTGLGQGTHLGVGIVQHITPGFEAGLATWLAAEAGLDVAIAHDGERLHPGCVRLAPGDAHLLLREDGILRLDRRTPPRHGHRPSVDELMLSVAETAPGHSAGVVMSGMGRDGAQGLAALRAAGGFTVVQDEASCVVYGMPRAALEAGGADLSLAPRAIGSLLRRSQPSRRDS